MENLTPPPELVEIIVGQAFGTLDKADFLQPEKLLEGLTVLATRAAQWGADQELEECVEWISNQDWTWTAAQLRAARRPKPPSLAEGAYIAFVQICKGNSDDAGTYDADEALVRRALERLQQLEEQQ